jgi:hypothetical protein
MVWVLIVLVLLVVSVECTGNGPTVAAQRHVHSGLLRPFDGNRLNVDYTQQDEKRLASGLSVCVLSKWLVCLWLIYMHYCDLAFIICYICCRFFAQKSTVIMEAAWRFRTYVVLPTYALPN